MSARRTTSAILATTAVAALAATTVPAAAQVVGQGIPQQVVDFFPAAVSPEGVDRFIITPGANAADAFSVTFRTGQGRNTFVEVRPAGTNDVTALGTYVSRTVHIGDVGYDTHSAWATGLAADTAYEVRPVVDGVADRWRTVRTGLAADAQQLTFTWLGDAQVGLDEEWPATSQAAAAAIPDSRYTMVAGDMINDPMEEDQWDSWFAGRADDSQPYLPALGNHEFTSGDLLTDAFRGYYETPRNGMDMFPETTYYIDNGPVRTIVLQANYTAMTLQAQWLDQVLSDDQHPWTVVMFHQPLYSATTKRDEPLVNAIFGPVLERHDVDLVTMGHDHAYARGHLSANDNGDGTSTGPVYQVTNGGGKYYETDASGTNWSGRGATRVTYAGGTTTYQKVTVDGCRMDVSAVVTAVGSEKYRLNSKPVGETLDAFSIDKCGETKVVRTTTGN